MYNLCSGFAFENEEKRTLF